MSRRFEPPGRLLQLMEGRAAFEYAATAAHLPVLRLQAPRGRGEPVMVLPGFMADDSSTWLLRSFLRAIGYRVSGWGLGRNRRQLLPLIDPLIERVARIRDNQQRNIRLVGWSRGGVLAREVSRERPDLVDRVITLGSPVKVGAGVSSIQRLVEAETGVSTHDIGRLMAQRDQTAITVPIVAIYSKSDGVVTWRACIDDASPHVEHHEVSGSHSGLGFNIEVFRLIAKALAAQHETSVTS